MMANDDHRRAHRARREKYLSASSATSAVIVTLARWRAWLAGALARRRVALGFVCGALVFWLAKPTGTMLVAGTSIAIVGECLRLWASGHLNKAREVTVSGPYRWFAHPLYVGSSVMGAGLAVASNSVAVAGVIAMYFAVTITAAIKNEEAFLRRSFGDRYDRYRRGRPNRAPVVAADEDADRQFSLAQAMANREHRALVGFAVAVLLLVLKATYNGSFWRAAGPH
jgi:protein-S-isoprenylcysteine O-methyltransferase Ste14